MAKIQCHPSAEMLTGFSAASLPLSQALCVSTHLERCSECRHSLQRLESVGGELFQRLKPCAPLPALRQQVLEKLDQVELDTNANTVQQVVRQAQTAGVPNCLRQFIPSDYDSLNWQRVSLSIQSSELCRDSNGAKVELLRIKAGGSSSTHTHLGDEYTVILKGSFSDEEGLYGEGDFIARDSSHHHTPVATRDGECICLAVTEAPIQFTGFFSRWLNPLVRRSYS